MYRSLVAEAQQPGTPSRGSINVKINDGCLILTIEAMGINDVRVLLNSYMYLLYAEYSTLHKLK